MINQAVSIQANSPYNDFNGYKRNPQFLLTTLPPKEEEHHHGKLAASIGITALIVGFGILGLMRGSPKNLTKYLEKLKGKIEVQLEKTKNNKSMKLLNQGYTYALNKINSLILKSECINNFTSLKDALAKYFMDKTKFTKKIHKGITNIFQKGSRATVRTSWSNTTEKFKKTFSRLDKSDNFYLGGQSDKIIEINGIKKTGSEWFEYLQECKKSVIETLNTNTSKDALLGREKQMEAASNNLDKLIRALFKNYKNPRLFRSFVADDFIMKEKEKMFMDMLKFRKIISMNTSDKQKITAEMLQKAENILLESDSPFHATVSKLRKALKSGKSISEKEVTEAIKTISSAIAQSKDKLKPKQFMHVQNYLNDAGKMINDNGSGKIQEMLNIYKAIVPDDDYKHIAKALNESVKALDDSINIESIQYFDKIRDLKIGSAPTDALSVVGSGAYIAYALHGTKDKDEKISMMLKEGIPVLGSVGTSLFCMARLVSGSKSLIVGLISGAIISAIGKYADELRKKYFPLNKQPQQTVQNTNKPITGNVAA